MTMSIGSVPEFPVALEGVDMTKFTAKEITLDGNKSFDENLRANFGISADQAAEIVNFALMKDIPLHHVAVEPVTEESMAGGAKGVMAAAMSGVAAVIGILQQGEMLTNIASSAITFVDQTADKFSTSSELYRTAQNWKATMDQHCPEVEKIPMTCSFLDFKCKILDAKEVGITQADYKYHAELCALARGKYIAAVKDIPAAERKAVESLGAAVTGVVSLANAAAMPKEDLDRLVREKVVDPQGKVLKAAEFSKYMVSRVAAPSDAEATARLASPTPAPSVVPSATAAPTRPPSLPYSFTAPEAPAATARPDPRNPFRTPLTQGPPIEPPQPGSFLGGRKRRRTIRKGKKSSRRRATRAHGFAY